MNRVDVTSCKLQQLFGLGTRCIACAISIQLDFIQNILKINIFKMLRTKPLCNIRDVFNVLINGKVGKYLTYLIGL